MTGQAIDRFSDSDLIRSEYESLAANQSISSSATLHTYWTQSVFRLILHS